MAICFLFVNPVLAKDPKADKAVKGQAKVNLAAPAEVTPETRQQQKDLLIANINNMRNQEVRVAVLQQLLNEEIAKLRNVQEAFCSQYKLDAEKLRKGFYRYDEKEEKFVEIEVPQVQP